jgi:molecular chaperone DnaJ
LKAGERQLRKDYYETLGLPRTASQDDIRKAFRKLAGENHPDKGGDAEKFKEINHAHQVLSDETKKALYDQFGTEDVTQIPPPQPRPGRRSPFGGPFGTRINLDDLNDIFQRNFDPFGPFGGGSVHDFARKARQPPAPSPGSDLHVEVSVSMEDALAGVKKDVRFDRGEKRPCTKCPGARRTVCPVCAGNGRVPDTFGRTMGVRQCGRCNGAGSVNVNSCLNCGGSGTEVIWRQLTLTIPAGVRDGQEMRAKGFGTPGNPPGDLMVKVLVRDADRWWARGNELFTIVEVGVGDLLRGGTVSFKVPDGRTLSVNVPAGGGRSKVPRAWKNPMSGGEDGDVVAIFRVRSDLGLTPRAERLMRELVEELEGRGRR